MRRTRQKSQTTSSLATKNIPHEILNFGDNRIDFTSMEATRAGKPLTLTAQEFKLLKFLAASQDVVLSRDVLLNEVWGYQNYPSSRTVDNHILSLRAKLEREPARPQRLLTVHGVGYAVEEPVPCSCRDPSDRNVHSTGCRRSSCGSRC